MWFLYTLTNNYAVALLLFTFIMRFAMMPVTLRQQKTSAKMAMFRPMQDELQKKYANNKQKYNEELQKLWKKENFNPASGCLPMMLTMFLLIGMIDIIYKPLTHILRIPSDVLASITEIAAEMGVITAAGQNMTRAPQLAILRDVYENAGYYQSSIDAEIIERMHAFMPQMNLFGIDLTAFPQMSVFSLLWLIPILSGLTSVLMTILTVRNTPAQPGAGSMKMMMYAMPVMSFFFTFQFPAGVGIYWIYSNTAGFVQQMVMNKLFNPKEMAEKAKQEMEERREKERLERIEAKKQAKAKGEDSDAGLSKKEAASRKLAQARKRDAEKYGDVYEDGNESD